MVLYNKVGLVCNGKNPFALVVAESLLENKGHLSLDAFYSGVCLKLQVIPVLPLGIKCLPVDMDLLGKEFIGPWRVQSPPFSNAALVAH